MTVLVTSIEVGILKSADRFFVYIGECGVGYLSRCFFGPDVKDLARIETRCWLKHTVPNDWQDAAQILDTL